MPPPSPRLRYPRPRSADRPSSREAKVRGRDKGAVGNEQGLSLVPGSHKPQVRHADDSNNTTVTSTVLNRRSAYAVVVNEIAPHPPGVHQYRDSGLGKISWIATREALLASEIIATGGNQAKRRG